MKCLSHEDDVDIAHIVELATPAFAHTDHRKPARHGTGWEPSPSNRERGLENGISEVGEPGPHGIHRRQPRNIARSNAEQVRAIGNTQRINRGREFTRCDRLGRRGLGSNRNKHLPSGAGRRWSNGQRLRINENFPVAWMPDEEFAKRLRHSKDVEETAAQVLVREERRPHPPASLRVAGLEDPAEQQQRLIRICRCPQTFEHVLLGLTIGHEHSERFSGNNPLRSVKFDEPESCEGCVARHRQRRSLA